MSNRFFKNKTINTKLPLMVLIMFLSIAICDAQVREKFKYQLVQNPEFSVNIIDTWKIADKEMIDSMISEERFKLFAPDFIKNIKIDYSTLRIMELVAVEDNSKPGKEWSSSLSIRKVETNGKKVEPETILPIYKEVMSSNGVPILKEMILLTPDGNKLVLVEVQIVINLANGSTFVTRQYSYSLLGDKAIWIMTFSTVSDRALSMERAFETMALSFKEK